ncbi:MAG: hypothetical protein LC797_03685 [Chloroflexi bacterium]|nr:hypothetical protein [Chloroflexota bacterium]
MATSRRRGGTMTVWICAWCRGGAEDEDALLDHQEWCLGDGVANTQLLSAVAERDGELTQEALVAAAAQQRRR